MKSKRTNYYFCSTLFSRVEWSLKENKTVEGPKFQHFTLYFWLKMLTVTLKSAKTNFLNVIFKPPPGGNVFINCKALYTKFAAFWNSTHKICLIRNNVYPISKIAKKCSITPPYWSACWLKERERERANFAYEGRSLEMVIVSNGWWCETACLVGWVYGTTICPQLTQNQHEF